MYTRSMTNPLALAYVRVSTTGQVEHGASLDAQKDTLTRFAEARGWDIEIVADEGMSAKDMNRPALQDALRRLDRGQAQYLMAVRLDRVSRSVADFASLMARSSKRHWGLVLTESAIDTFTPAGRFNAHILVSAAEYERALIGARTSEGMQQRIREGAIFGRMVDATMLPTYQRIGELHAAGESLNAIARQLTADRVNTAAGGQRWYASTVRAVLLSKTMKRLAA